MWVLLGVVVALGLFGLLFLTNMEQDQNSAFHAALSAMETQSAQQMNAFTAAAWNYATANNVSTGTTISVAQLVKAGLLPTAFAVSNPFGQTLVALTGNGTLAAYYQNPPNTLYGEPVTPRTEKGVAMKMAEKLSAMQENAPQYVAAISYNGGTGAYTQALLPYASTAITPSANDPQFRTSFPSLLDLVNVLPATGLSAGVTASTNSGGCGVMQAFSSPGTYHVSVPSCAKSVTAYLAGAGGGDSGQSFYESWSGNYITGNTSYHSGGTGYTFSGTIAIPSGTSELTVLTGGAGGVGANATYINSPSSGGGGGGLSALCSGSSCTPNSAMMVAGGGGGASGGNNGGNAGLSDNSFSSQSQYFYNHSVAPGGPGYGGGFENNSGISYGGGGSGYNGGGDGGYGGGGGASDGGGGGGGGYNGGAGGGSGYGGQSYYGNSTNIQVGPPTPADYNGIVIITFNQH